MIHDKCRVHKKVHEAKAKNCSYRKSHITLGPRGRVRYSNRLYTGGKLTIACNHSHLRYNNNNNNADKNESTEGADASVEMPKLHNIKLLIAFIHD